MKKIIDGKRYDTETAKEIAYYKDGCCGDFRRFEETLYLKKTGEYFLSGSGGPMTSYGEVLSDGSIGWGEDICPLTLTRAKRWVEDNCNERYEEIFGKVEE